MPRMASVQGIMKVITAVLVCVLVTACCADRVVKNIIKRVPHHHGRVHHVYHFYTKNHHHVKKIPLPYKVQIEKKVPVPVKVYLKEPYHVYVPKPYHVEVQKEVHVPVHVPVEKPYPVYVEKKTPYTVEVPVHKHVPVPVKEYVGVPEKVPVYVYDSTHHGQDLDGSSQLGEEFASDHGRPYGHGFTSGAGHSAVSNAQQYPIGTSSVGHNADVHGQSFGSELSDKGLEGNIQENALASAGYTGHSEDLSSSYEDSVTNHGLTASSHAFGHGAPISQVSHLDELGQSNAGGNVAHSHHEYGDGSSVQNGASNVHGSQSGGLGTYYEGSGTFNGQNYGPTLHGNQIPARHEHQPGGLSLNSALSASANTAYGGRPFGQGHKPVSTSYEPQAEKLVSSQEANGSNLGQVYEHGLTNKDFGGRIPVHEDVHENQSGGLSTFYDSNHSFQGQHFGTQSADEYTGNGVVQTGHDSNSADLGSYFGNTKTISGQFPAYKLRGASSGHGLLSARFKASYDANSNVGGHQDASPVSGHGNGGSGSIELFGGNGFEHGFSGGNSGHQFSGTERLNARISQHEYRPEYYHRIRAVHPGHYFTPMHVGHRIPDYKNIIYTKY